MTPKVILLSYPNYKGLIEKLRGLGIEVAGDELGKHGVMTFDLQGVSRVLTHQMVRHRLGSFSQQSQRYVKITRSYGFVKPPSISDELKVQVKLGGLAFSAGFEDVMDITRQVEEGLVARGLKAEDARFVRPNAATSNLVVSMSPKALLHLFYLRCAQDAQWEIRCVCWAMLACAKLVAPEFFREILLSTVVLKALNDKLNAVVDGLREDFDTYPPGELFEIPLSGLGFEYEVKAYVLKRF